MVLPSLTAAVACRNSRCTWELDPRRGLVFSDATVDDEEGALFCETPLVAFHLATLVKLFSLPLFIGSTTSAKVASLCFFFWFDRSEEQRVTDLQGIRKEGGVKNRRSFSP